MQAVSQKQAIVNHLYKVGHITSMEAFEHYGATRLSAIIHVLRHNEGMNIETRMVVGKTRYGTTKEYAKYILHKEVVKDE